MRPKIKLIPTGLDKVLDAASAALLVVLWAITIYAFVKMPDIIPTHYNGSGSVDDYGSKATILILPLVTTVILFVLTGLNRYPHIFNYPTEITEANAERQYTLAIRMLRFLKLAIVIIFTEIVVSTYLITQGTIKGLGGWIIPFELSIIAIPIIIVFIQSGKKQGNV